MKGLCEARHSEDGDRARAVGDRASAVIPGATVQGSGEKTRREGGDPRWKRPRRRGATFEAGRDQTRGRRRWKRRTVASLGLLLVVEILDKYLKKYSKSQKKLKWKIKFCWTPHE